MLKNNDYDNYCYLWQHNLWFDIHSCGIYFEY